MNSTEDQKVGQKKCVIDFAGLAEIRPDEGIMLLRVPVNGAVMVEEARSLVDGARDERQSGYRHTDIRGSTLARADGLPSGLVSRIHRPVKLAGAFACCASLSNLTVSARSLDKSAAPGDLPCARSGNACN
ncbi:hypothetical protein [Bradymonas sediminis]|uniref:hypothetical protein n=1 Tax=Bradymonas sediminis TaxID=1548548 RepID=UPI00105E1EA1|nr:hypothetical protein [Bradymonas sediminis]TDP76379.1 hypothetical protein DFR33_1028 [Bradymonas sediminis]